MPSVLLVVTELRFLKSVLAEAAGGADPIGGNIFPGSAGSYAVIGIANGGIVFIAAGANVFFHNCISLDIFRIDDRLISALCINHTALR